MGSKVGTIGARRELNKLSSSFFFSSLAGSGDCRMLIELGGGSLGSSERVEGALRALEAKHSALRTRVVVEGGRAIFEEAAPNWTGLLEPARAGSWDDQLRSLKARHFDPAEGRSFCAAWRPEGRGGRLAVLFDHTVFDGWSLRLWTDELAAILEGKQGAAGEAPGLVEAERLKAARQDPVREAMDLGYWSTKLADWRGCPQLPAGAASAAGEAVFEAPTQVLDGALVQAIQKREKSAGLQPLSLVAAALGKVLAFWLRTDRLVLNLPVLGRPSGGGLRRALGNLTDIVPLDLRGLLAAPPAELALAASQALADSAAHAGASGVDIARRLAQANGGRAAAFSPVTLTPALFMDWSKHPALRVEAIWACAPETWLDLMVFSEGESWRVMWNHRCDQLGSARVQRMMSQFERALRGLARAEDQDLFLDFLDGEDLALHRALGAAPGAVVSGLLTATRTFEARACEAPNSVAVSGPASALTYGELNRAANRLARALQAKGVGRGSLVGIHLKRSEKVVLAMLGVLKSGAAYLPMDPLYPGDRLAFMAADAALAAIITEDGVAPAFAAALPALAPGSGQEFEATDLPEGPSLEDLAYVIYTSGSTGQPKGAMIRHRELARLFTATQPWFGSGPDDVWTLFHSYSFDFSVWEVWGALLHGGRLVVVPEECARSPRDFLDLLRREKVTVLSQTPSAFSALSAAEAAAGPGAGLRDLRVVVFGGEALDLASLASWYERHPEDAPRLVNMYGITETTVHVTYRPLKKADAVPGAPSLIGVPIPDMQLRLLDEAGRLVPVGVAGEIHVGGEGLALGYLGRPELTASRFVSSPWGRLYKSGDLARLLPSGELEYLGRADQQVKVRGFRVELGEVQARLREHPSIAEAAVVLRKEGAAQGRLAAYVTLREGAELGEEAARALLAGLARQMPPYMVPAFLQVLPRLPLTVNGKLDQAALPEPGALLCSRALAAPADSLEAELLELWKAQLGLEQAGVEDDFFASGGHSLAAAAFHARALEAAGAELGLAEFLAEPTVRGLAARLKQAKPRVAALPQGSRVAAPAPLAGLWSAASRSRGGTFHIAWTLRTVRDLDLTRLERALTEMAAMQPALRCRFAAGDEGELWQQADAPMPRVEELSQGMGPSQVLQQELAQAWAAAPFDLAKGPLWRVGAMRGLGGGWSLVFAFHHLIFDLASFGLFHDALAQAYDQPGSLQGEGKGVLPAAAPAAEGERDRAFWAQRLEGLAPLALADRQGLPAAAPAKARLVLQAETAAALTGLARGEQATSFAVAAAAWAAALAEVLQRGDVAFATPMSTRQAALEMRSLGYWVNPLPCRVALAPGMTGRALLRAVAAEAKQAWAHRGSAFWDAVPRLAAPGGPLDCFLVFQDEAPRRLPLFGGSTAGALDVGEPKAAVSMQVEAGEAWTLTLEHDPSRVSEPRAMALLKAMERALLKLAAEPDALLGSGKAPALLRGRPVEPGAHRTVVERFHWRVGQDPEAPALLVEGRSVDYGTLSRLMRSVARHLDRCGAKAGERIGVCTRPTPGWVAAMLGCFEASCVYVPLDPDYPSGRLAAMAKESGLRLVLSDQARPAWAEAAGLAWLDVDQACLAEPPYLRQPGRPAPAEAAYVIFTSGSTGSPRGVQVSHRALHNHAVGYARALGLAPSDRVLQFVSISFDPSLEEVLPTLCSGAALCLPSRKGAPTAVQLNRWAEELGASVLHLPAAYWHAWMQSLPPEGLDRLGALRAVVVGGEAPEARLVRRLAELGRGRVDFFNAYGPTEACITSAIWGWDGGGVLPEPVPLGAPLPGVDLAVVGTDGALLSRGEEGELWISGEGLADGYLSSDGLKDLGVAKADLAAGRSRWYRTGDRASLDAEGKLCFLGRLDAQMKLSGHRVDLAGLESVLAAAPGVGGAMARPLEREGGKAWEAWVRPLNGPGIDLVELRSFLSDRLPAACLPERIQVVAELPMTPNGKLDRRAAEPLLLEGPGPLEGRVAELCKAWEKALGRKGLGPDSDFFANGGTSLRVVRLAAEVSTIAGREVGVEELRQRPTPRSLAAALGPGKAPAAPPLPLPAGKGAPWVLLPPVSGRASAYEGLARELSEHAPVLALEARLRQGGPPPTWDELVQGFAEDLVSALPQGELCLGGWSIGGLLAVDVAAQLHRRGRTVRRLALFDCVIPDLVEGALARIEPAMLDEAFDRDLAALEGSGQGEAPLMEDGPWLERFRAMAGAIEGFKPNKLVAPLTLVISEETARREPKRAWTDWSLLADKGMTALLVPGDHYSLLRGRALKRMAKRLASDAARGPLKATVGEVV